MRACLTRHSSHLDRVAFICTEGGTGGKRAFRHMLDLIGQQPVATLEVTESDLKTGADKDTLHPFIDAVLCQANSWSQCLLATVKSGQIRLVLLFPPISIPRFPKCAIV